MNVFRPCGCRIALLAAVFLFRLVFATPALAQTVGAPLPPFVAGGLDIHHINTGEGSAALVLLPDGTTLLIDCGFSQELTRAAQYKAPRKPDESRLPGEWVARYVQRVLPREAADRPLDYAVISHLHADHMAGVPDFLRHVRVRTWIDRGWPDYGAPLPFTGPLAALYKAALAGEVKQHAMTVERFRVGAADQIVLRHQREKFPTVEIRQLAANGAIWTGEGTASRQRLDLNTKLDENACSAVLRLRYGRFDYFTGGDLPGASESPKVPLSHDLESAVAWVTGPVDVAVLNHHGNSDSSSAFFLSVLQPRVMLAQVWASRQVDPETLARLRSERIYPGPRDIFMTNGLWEGRTGHILQTFGETEGRAHLAHLATLAATQGHIVVRVAPGGDTYQVIVLDDSDESLRVRSLHGPYTSR